MRTLVSKHKINQIPVAWTLLLSLLTLTTAWFSLIALGPHQSVLCHESGIVGGEVIPQQAPARRARCEASLWAWSLTEPDLKEMAYTDLALAAI